MAQAVATAASYRAQFEALASTRRDEPAWLRDLREDAFGSFERLGFPIGEKRDEAWKYTDVRPIAETDFHLASQPNGTPDLAHHIPDDGGALRMVFVDGHFVKEASSAPEEVGLVAIALRTALQQHESAVRENLARPMETDRGPFVALNTALFRDGAFIMASGTVQRPVHVVHVTTDHRDKVVTFPRTLIVASDAAELTVIETFVSLGSSNHFTDPVAEVVMTGGAKVAHYRLLIENQASYSVGHVRPVLGRDTTYESVVFEAGSGLARLDLEAIIDGEGAAADLKGAYITAGDQHIDNLISIDHRKPHGTSRMYYKGVLDDRSEAVFGGTVFVRKGADKTDAHQEDKNLLLSEDAIVNSKPALEIYADDVKAGHGATAGAIADEALFYMQSRGIDADTAMRLLVQGFASEILEGVGIEPLRDWLENRVMQALPRFQGAASA